MIPLIQEISPVEVSSSFKTVAFTLDISRMAHLFNMLSKQTYSNPIAAVLREYSTNGIDSMIEAGTINTHNLIVTLPTSLDSTLKIRDFGTGMTEEKVMGIFTQFGNSTKDASNDFNGMLGIGSKSAYAYTSSWMIVSYLNGKKTTYNAYVDSNHCPQLSRLTEELTDEHNGVEIIIPVISYDITSFKNNATNIFKYFDPKYSVIVHNKNSEDNDKIITEGKDWKLKETSFHKTTLVAVMGNVGYPVEWSELITSPTEEDKAVGVKGILNSYRPYINLELLFDIGELNFSISRESLHYTEATKRALTIKIEKAFEEIIASALAEINKCDNVWDAHIKLKEITEQGYKEVFTALGKNINHLSKFPIFFNGIIYNSDLDVIINSYRCGRDKVYRCTRANIRISSHNTVIINDVSNHNRGLRAIVGKYIEDKGLVSDNEVYTVTFATEKAKKAFFDKTQLDKAPCVKLSTLPKPTTKSVRDAKATANFFTFNLNKYTSYDNKEHWDVSNVDYKTEGGLYLGLDKYAVQNSQFTVASLYHTLNHLKALGVVDTIPTVYGVKRKMVEKLDNQKWEKFDTWVDRKINEYVTNNPDSMETYVNQSRILKNYSRLRITSLNDNFIQCPDSPFRRVIELLYMSADVVTSVKQWDYLFGRVTVKLPKASQTESIIGLMKNYPLIAVYNLNHIDKDQKDYINAMDLYRKSIDKETEAQ